MCSIILHFLKHESLFLRFAPFPLKSIFLSPLAPLPMLHLLGCTASSCTISRRHAFHVEGRTSADKKKRKEKGKRKCRRGVKGRTGQSAVTDLSTFSYSPAPHKIGVGISGNLAPQFRIWDCKCVNGCAQTDGWQRAPR